MNIVDLSVIIPTYNERANILPLVTQIERALVSSSWELLFVDDSTDGTDDLIGRLAREDRRIRLLHRLENRGGLAGAVVEGFAQTRGTYVCVMDADLQHPPSRIADMLAEAHRASADFVIASRYMPGGSAGGLDGTLRQVMSRSLKLLARLAFPRRLAGITDPLGGYFLVRRSITEPARLRPVGYKILLELLIRCRWRTVSEVPYRFQPRHGGNSKADFRQGLRFLRHLARLMADCSPVFGALRRLSGGRLFDTGAPARLLPLK